MSFSPSGSWHETTSAPKGQNKFKKIKVLNEADLRITVQRSGGKSLLSTDGGGHVGQTFDSLSLCVFAQIVVVLATTATEDATFC